MASRTKSMDRSILTTYIRERRRKRSPLLMTHLVVGYPSLDENWRMLQNMSAVDVDIVELQLPFSEPIADGPWFIRANQAAIERGITWDQYFDLVKRAAEAFSMPILFMGYYNSVFKMGHDIFCRRLRDSGARGYIIADLPPEDAVDLNDKARRSRLDPVLLMTPTNSDARLAAIARQASGCIYCVARKGVTGKRTDFALGVEEFMRRCRRSTDLPLALGFGIKRPDDVRVVRGLADIAIVGTACLEAWESLGEKGYRDFLEELMAATRS